MSPLSAPQCAFARLSGTVRCRGLAPPWYRRPELIRGLPMAETADDLSTPLGQKTVRSKRRFRLPFTGIQALAVLLGLFLVAFVGFAIFNDNPLGGEPIAHVAIRQATAPAGDKSAAAPCNRARTGREVRGQAGRAGRPKDRHHHRRLQRHAPRRRDRRHRAGQGRGRRRPRHDGRDRLSACWRNRATA